MSDTIPPRPQRRSRAQQARPSAAASRSSNKKVRTCGDNGGMTDDGPCAKPGEGKDNLLQCWMHRGKSSGPQLSGVDLSNRNLPEGLAKRVQQGAALNTIDEAGEPAGIYEIADEYLNSDAVGSNRSPCLWGSPGIGKTEIVQQACEENGYELYTFPLATADSITIEGIPILGDDGKTHTYSIPEAIEHIRRQATGEGTGEDGEDGKPQKVCLFFDEINHASDTVINALFPALRVGRDGNRTLGTHKLPGTVKVIAAGNPPAFNASTAELPDPMKDRMKHFWVTPNKKAWLGYMDKMVEASTKEAVAFAENAPDDDESQDAALQKLFMVDAMGNQVLPAIASYLSEGNDQYFDAPELEKKAGRSSTEYSEYAQHQGSPTPRAWTDLATQLSSTIALAKMRGGNVRSADIHSRAVSHLGQTAGHEFANHMINVAHLPSPEDALRRLGSGDFGANDTQMLYQMNRVVRYVKEVNSAAAGEQAMRAVLNIATGKDNFPRSMGVAQSTISSLLEVMNQQQLEVNPELSRDLAAANLEVAKFTATTV